MICCLQPSPLPLWCFWRSLPRLWFLLSAPQPMQRWARPALRRVRSAPRRARPAPRRVRPAQRRVRPVQQRARPVQRRVRPVQQRARPVQRRVRPVQRWVHRSSGKTVRPTARFCRSWGRSWVPAWHRRARGLLWERRAPEGSAPRKHRRTGSRQRPVRGSLGKCS